MTPTLSLEVPAVDEIVVDFTGPWANEFRTAYEKASDPAARFILQDEKVTAEELAEANATYQSCLEGAGFTKVVINNDGSMSVVPPPAMKDDSEAYSSLIRGCCDQGWCDISALYNFVKGNPDNADFAQIMAECLVRTGLKPVGYSADDYLADSHAEDYQMGSPEMQKYMACNADPAHAG
ncbi:MAG: hypothetical protein LBI84_11005 [Propionibacteriaceae bacterium]|nr:hypothetical protein [Propionibacteriaceae bacterium]